MVETVSAVSIAIVSNEEKTKKVARRRRRTRNRLLRYQGLETLTLYSFTECYIRKEVYTKD